MAIVIILSGCALTGAQTEDSNTNSGAAPQSVIELTFTPVVIAFDGAQAAGLLSK
jgi:hypothetical protein